MKYLKTVILENFQSHKYTSVNFDEGLNVILGPSDSGKTAIIRGIKWALYNEPSGDYFIREGESEASVTLIFSDNTKIKRFRSKSKNSYVLFKKNGEEVKYEGFGTSVPTEIIEEIGIKKIQLDSDATNAINISEQLEGSFLLSEKNSTRAGAIGRLIGVNVIDDALKDTLKDIRNLSNTKKSTELRISKIEDELKEYEYLEELNTKLKKAEELRHVIHEKANKQEKLKTCYYRYKQLNQEFNIINVQITKLKNVEDIDPLVQKIEKNIINFKYYNIKRVQYRNYQLEIKDDLNLINRLVNIEDVDEIINKTDQLFIRIYKLLTIKRNLDMVVRDKIISNNIYTKLERLSAVEKSVSSFEKKATIISRLVKLRDDYNSNQSNIEVGYDFIKRFDGLESSESFYKDIFYINNRLIELKEIHRKIRVLGTHQKDEIKELNNFKKEIDVNLNKYKEQLTKIEICPFCLSDIDIDKIEHIISHYD
ncbi:MAG: AAA family ATPase [Tissierellaceae bacterium]|nr:AAA family ATPase [Tissierellaceae bacterium]